MYMYSFVITLTFAADRASPSLYYQKFNWFHTCNYINGVTMRNIGVLEPSVAWSEIDNFG